MSYVMVTISIMFCGYMVFVLAMYARNLFWPGRRIRFSLRAMLITTTVFAVVLGAMIWLAE